ncbi:MAG TPA: hypothetical protein VN721_16390 [Flavipsychrobacter sp.]|nr:hypothetical protein [Flavipsychrobacter sp.]
MRKIFIVAIIMLSLSSCSNIIVHRNFTYCAHDPNNFFTELRTDGYYFLNTRDYIAVFLIYKDGTFANLWLGVQTHKEIHQYFETTSHKVLMDNNMLGWGRYIITGDTLKAQYIAEKDAPVYNVIEHWYVIKNDSTLQAIKSICRFCKDNSTWKKGVYVYNTPTYYHLMHYTNKPDSVCWIKKKRWYKCKD